MDALPTKFRRWVASEAAPSFREAAQLRTVKLEPPRGDEVLVRTLYATVNAGHDTFVARREGYFANIIGIHDLGADSLGQVVALGEEVSDLEVGDYVTCLFCGSYSEYTTPKSQNCFKVGSPKPEYAALRIGGTYSSAVLEHVAKIETGGTLLVTAACGGVGHLAVQFGKLNGCHVIGTCGSENKRAKLLELGVDRVIDYKKESLSDVLEKDYPEGIDYVMDGVGGELAAVAFRNLAPNGKLLCIGFFAQYPHTGKYDVALRKGLTEEAPPLAEMFWSMSNLTIGDKQIVTSTWPKDTSTVQHCRERAFSLFDEGRLEVILDEHVLRNVSGIENVIEAVDYMLTGKNVGKVLIQIALET